MRWSRVLIPIHAQMVLGRGWISVINGDASHDALRKLVTMSSIGDWQ